MLKHYTIMLQFIPFYIIPWCYRSLWARVYQLIASLSFTCPQKELKDHPASLGVMCDEHIKSSSPVALIDQDYFYTSVVMQIPHNAGWHRTIYWPRIPLPPGIEQPPLSILQVKKIHTFNCMATGLDNYIHYRS